MRRRNRLAEPPAPPPAMPTASVVGRQVVPPALVRLRATSVIGPLRLLPRAPNVPRPLPARPDQRRNGSGSWPRDSAFSTVVICARPLIQHRRSGAHLEFEPLGPAGIAGIGPVIELLLESRGPVAAPASHGDG